MGGSSGSGDTDLAWATRSNSRRLLFFVKTCVEFAQSVQPRNYKLFQVADLLCTVALIEQRLLNGEHMTDSEYAFFGGPRMFKRNILKYLKRKEI